MNEKSENIPVHVDRPEEPEEGGWREVAQHWRGVGKQVLGLSERLASAFKMGWQVEEMTEREARGVAEGLRALGERMERAVEAVREEAKKAETKSQAKETATSTRKASREFFSELEETLNEGFQDLNRRIDEVVKKRRTKKGTKEE